MSPLMKRPRWRRLSPNAFAAMRRANEQMARDQAEIERLKAETRQILAQLEAA